MEHKLTGEEMYRKINQKRRLTSLFTLIAILIALLFDSLSSFLDSKTTLILNQLIMQL